LPGPYRLIFSTCTLHINREKKPVELFVTFASRENIREAHFRGPIAKELRAMDTKRLDEKVLKAIEETAPTGTVTFRAKRVYGGTAYSIHPEHLRRWAERVKSKLEE
jgi:hypothetical protein